MDWCIQCGHEHIVGSPYWLTPSNPPQPKEKIKPKPKKTKKEKLMDHFREHSQKNKWQLFKEM
jgi:hypothetical protein